MSLATPSLYLLDHCTSSASRDMSAALTSRALQSACPAGDRCRSSAARGLSQLPCISQLACIGPTPWSRSHIAPTSASPPSAFPLSAFPGCSACCNSSNGGTTSSSRICLTDAVRDLRPPPASSPACDRAIGGSPSPSPPLRARELLPPRRLERITHHNRNANRREAMPIASGASSCDRERPGGGETGGGSEEGGNVSGEGADLLGRGGDFCC